MKSDLETNSTTSPPSKKLRTADFSSIIKRSHSMTEEALEIEMSSAYKKKIVNDRYTVGQKIKKVWSKKLKHIYIYTYVYLVMDSGILKNPTFGDSI